jgi:hypothetical protein
MRRKQEDIRMKPSRIALIITLAVLAGTLSLSALAQSSGGTSGSSQTTTTQTTRTTETSQPTTVQVTRATGINPLWLGVGAVVLLAIVAIAALGARGRSADRAAVVHERETVVRRE